MNKKGNVSSGFIIAIIVICLIAAILFIVAYLPTITKVIKPVAPVWLDTKSPKINWDGPFGLGLTYIFGVDKEKAQAISALISLIAVWVIFFLVFGDSINKFGFFSQTVGWIIGFAMAVILANVGFYYNILINLMALFSFLASLAVIGALASIFVFMFAAHWGISKLGPRMMMRKAMMEGAKAEAGGKELAGKLKGLKLAGEALKQN